MRIINYEYFIPTLILFIGLPFLLYIKIAQQPIEPLSITIYGSTIETAMFAYYIDKNLAKIYGEDDQKYLNITLVSPFENPANENKTKKETDKVMVNFCGVEHHLLGMLTDLNMQFEIDEYSIHFSSLKAGHTPKQVSTSDTYKIQEQYPFQSFFEYGLSHMTAKNIFSEFQNYIDSHSGDNFYRKGASMDQLSMGQAISNIFPYGFHESGIQYLSEVIGLDQQYIHDYIMPVIWGSYLHEPNSITSMFRLLPLFCTKNKAIGSSLAILIDQIELFEALISKLEHVNIKRVYSHHLQEYSIIEGVKSFNGYEYSGKSEHNINRTSSEYIESQSTYYSESNTEILATYLNMNSLTQTNNSIKDDQKDRQKGDSDETEDNSVYVQMKTNLLFIIEDYEMANKKEISYYKTIVDGKLIGDSEQQGFFTLYFTYDKDNSDVQEQEKSHRNTKYIYSATRLCAQNCKGFNNNVYMLISKQKLSDKDLLMFEEQHIVYYRKFWHPKTQTPSQKKFEQTEGVYRILDTESISESYEVKLSVFDQLSTVVIDKMSRANG